MKVVYCDGIGSEERTYPFGRLFVGAGQALFGVTQNDGATVFEIQPFSSQGGKWTYSQLTAFDPNSGGGIYPYAGVIVDMPGNVYGTTRRRGELPRNRVWDCAASRGVIYGSDDKLYGTTVKEAYSLQRPSTPGQPWIRTFLADILPNGENGYSAYCDLALGRSGTLFGTTGGSGTYNSGTAFQLMPPTQ